MICDGYGVYFQGEENDLELDSGVGNTLCEYTKSQLTVHFKRVNFTCELYLKKKKKIYMC